MAQEQSRFKQQYADLLLEFVTVFPDIAPPDSSWFVSWLTKYTYGAIRDSIRSLGSNNPNIKNRFTTESCGRALSAMLRDQAIRDAVKAVKSSTSAPPSSFKTFEVSLRSRKALRRRWHFTLTSKTPYRICR
jgi:hypothetical protein